MIFCGKCNILKYAIEKLEDDFDLVYRPRTWKTPKMEDLFKMPKIPKIKKFKL